MFLHLLKMIWFRKRSNILIIVEIAIAFMIVFSISVFTVRNFNLYQIPLGFEYKNMWRIEISDLFIWSEEDSVKRVEQILNSLKQQSEIENVHLMRYATFGTYSLSDSYELDDRKISFNKNIIDDGAAEFFGLELVAGRWFNQKDEGQNYNPVIVNQLFAEKYFPNESVIGKNIANQYGEKSSEYYSLGTYKDEEFSGQVKEEKVVGVFKNFRQAGEFSSLNPYVFERYDFNPERRVNYSGIEIKVKPGTKIIYEEKLKKLLNSIEPEWEYNISTWESKRSAKFRETLTPLIILAIVSCFLIIMVAMGLFGVLWQNVTSRTHEIGLRRALGATRTQIQKQVISELLVITLLGVLCALIILVQLPLLGIFSELDWTLFSLSLLLATVFMLIMSTLCAYYPGRIAAMYKPAEALHYE